MQSGSGGSISSMSLSSYNLVTMDSIVLNAHATEPNEKYTQANSMYNLTLQSRYLTDISQILPSIEAIENAMNSIVTDW